MTRWAVLGAGAWGGAQRDAVRIIAVALGFLGVIAVLRPSINEDQWLAALLGMGAGAMSAIAMLQIRQLGRIGEPEYRVVFYFSLFGTLVGLALMGIVHLGQQQEVVDLHVSFYCVSFLERCV